MQGLLFDHSVATRNSADKPVNLIFCHLAFLDMILLTLQMLCKVCVKHLVKNNRIGTVILVFNG